MNSSEWYWTLVGVFGLGLQTAICPCPLATNIAAMAYIGRRLKHVYGTFFSGLLYTLGQIIAYLALSFLVLGLPNLAGDQVARWLTATFHQLLGPVMVVIGMVLAGLIVFPFQKESDTNSSYHAQKWVDRLGLWSALPLGLFFALSLCPTTAAMFLAMLILATKADSMVIFPAVFALGQAIPVICFAALLAFQVRWLGRVCHSLEKVEWLTRPIVGVLFIILGLAVTLGLW